MASVNPQTNPWLALPPFIIVCVAVGLSASFITASSVADWYPTLAKPAWTPPNWIFAPVWTALYIAMGFAAWLVWKKDMRFAGVRAALILFVAQLALNFSWSFVFFGFRMPGLALVNIVMLFMLIAMTAFAFFQQSRWAGIIMLPYLAWVGFATALNFAIWRLN